MFWIELVEGKSRPRQMGPMEHDDKGGKTIGLQLQLTNPVWGTGKEVILDSGFCVLKGIIELKKRGVFAGALVKKCRYWPKYIRGDDIKAQFESKEVGDIDAWHGTLDNIPFHLFCMKEPAFVITIMATYGTLEMSEKLTSRSYLEGNVKKQKTFAYSKVIYNHYNYRHLVDDHNAKRHSPISLKKVWATKWWPNRVFAFLLAITEVNIMLAQKHLCKVEISSMLQL
jgi:hypothetical protein